MNSICEETHWDAAQSYKSFCEWGNTLVGQMKYLFSNRKRQIQTEAIVSSGRFSLYGDKTSVSASLETMQNRDTWTAKEVQKPNEACNNSDRLWEIHFELIATVEMCKYIYGLFGSEYLKSKTVKEEEADNTFRLMCLTAC